MNTSEQVTHLVGLVDALASGRLERARESLAMEWGWMRPDAKTRLASGRGLSADQFEEWLSGRWTPPNDQCMGLNELALERLAVSLGLETVAVNGNGAKS